MTFQLHLLGGLILGEGGGGVGVGLPYKKRIWGLVGNFEKNPSVVPRKSFVGTTCNFFHP